MRNITVNSNSTHNISPLVRLYLAAALDPGDWRRVAAGLRLGRGCSSWLETRPSPTDCLLSLWEAASCAADTEAGAAVAELVTVLRCTVGPDLAAALHREAGSWV